MRNAGAYGRIQNRRGPSDMYARVLDRVVKRACYRSGTGEVKADVDARQHRTRRICIADITMDALDARRQRLDRVARRAEMRAHFVPAPHERPYGGGSDEASGGGDGGFHRGRRNSRSKASSRAVMVFGPWRSTY